MSHNSSECLTVTVTIATLGARLARISLPQPQAGVDYLILLQAPEEALSWGAEALQNGRKDVEIVARPDRGLSNSRNAALDLARGDLVLFSDDDVILNPKGIVALRTAFLEFKDLVLAVGWRAERLPKQVKSNRLTRFNSGRICAPEFMVHRQKILALGVRFDPAFGLGALHEIGEDYVFVTDILRAGGLGRALPVTVGSHPYPSTGDQWHTPALLAARRAVLDRVFGTLAPLVRLAYAVKHRGKFSNRRAALRFALGMSSGDRV
ncbi:MAG: glycosyltransferase [Sulfitobacter sp.]